MFSCESDDKPGSVADDHSSMASVTGWLKRPTREFRDEVNPHRFRGSLSYMVLLRVEFAAFHPAFWRTRLCGTIRRVAAPGR